MNWLRKYFEIIWAVAYVIYNKNMSSKTQISYKSQTSKYQSLVNLFSKAQGILQIRTFLDKMHLFNSLNNFLKNPFSNHTYASFRTTLIRQKWLLVASVCFTVIFASGLFLWQSAESSKKQAMAEQQAKAEEATPKIVPTTIVINGTPVVALPSEAEAKQVMQEVVDIFTSKQATEGMTVKSYEMMEKVEYKPYSGFEPPTVSDIASAVALLSKSKQEVVTYQIQKGESLSVIAEKQQVPLSVLIDANPGLKPERLQIGQEIKLVKPSYHVNIRTTYIHELQEEIPVPVKEIKDNSLGWSKAVVREEGEKGLKEATYLLVKENNLLINQELLEEKVLKEPQPRVIAKGERYLVVSRGDTKYAWPSSVRTISSPFGPRWGGFHTGVDLGTKTGTPIAATASGVVTSAGWAGGYGKQVIIDHGGGVKSAYAHLSTILVGNGQRVEQGEIIGKSGATGNVTGAHLHFEIIVGGQFKNPLNYIR